MNNNTWRRVKEKSIFEAKTEFDVTHSSGAFVKGSKEDNKLVWYVLITPVGHSDYRYYVALLDFK